MREGTVLITLYTHFQFKKSIIIILMRSLCSCFCLTGSISLKTGIVLQLFQTVNVIINISLGVLFKVKDIPLQNILHMFMHNI